MRNIAIGCHVAFFPVYVPERRGSWTPQFQVSIFLFNSNAKQQCFHRNDYNSRSYPNSGFPCYPKISMLSKDFHVIQRFPCYPKISLLSNRQIVKLVLPPPLIHTSLVASWSSLRPHLPFSLYRVSCVWFGQNKMKPNIRGLKLY